MENIRLCIFMEMMGAYFLGEKGSQLSSQRQGGQSEDFRLHDQRHQLSRGIQGNLHFPNIWRKKMQIKIVAYWINSGYPLRTLSHFKIRLHWWIVSSNKHQARYKLWNLLLSLPEKFGGDRICIRMSNFLHCWREKIQLEFRSRSTFFIFGRPCLKFQCPK